MSFKSAEFFCVPSLGSPALSKKIYRKNIDYYVFLSNILRGGLIKLK